MRSELWGRQYLLSFTYDFRLRFLSNRHVQWSITVLTGLKAGLFCLLQFGQRIPDS